MSEIKLFKLINGLEVIGKLEEELPEQYNISDAFFVMIMPTKEQPGTISFKLEPVSYAMKFKNVNHAGADISLQKRMIMFCVDPVDDLNSHYSSLTSNIIRLR